MELLLGIGRFVLSTTLLLLLTVPTAFIVIQIELKVIALMQLRYGPNRVGPRGVFQSTIHGFKVLAKEDTTPDQADRPTFTMAPWMVFMAAAMSMLVIPWAPGLVAVDSQISVVYFFAVLGLSVVGLLVAGWASYNKYSLLGGLRSAAQMVSYEIPLTLSIVGLVVLTGSLSFTGIVEWQRINGWGFFWQFWAFPIFFIAATAEINRTPFDMVEADSEIVAGFATEYSGMRFGFFFFAEYVTVFIVSALTVTLFFGGWNAPFNPRPILDFFHIGSLTPNFDVASLGIWLLWILAFGVPLILLLIALPLWMLKSGWSFVKSLIVAFVIFNVLAVG